MKTENINGFIWAVLDDENEAIDLWENDNEVFLLYPDGSESFVIDHEEILTAEEKGLRLGIEIGAEKGLTADYHETVEIKATSANKENRSFEEWCLSKIE